eukprot:CAMPEP_0173099626 /NCGR_PEP_ID=MMETSP1102-20130122/35619_1 /TAXON_ID=49646 /ORGANISM="Geminigera sp., Strain Caron Lab Isolate" /LENGTH=198 /DNA_ID=CAMNT_0013992711 /DNA_START=120 /DNA_END=716 /DNA_ORIENTATION=+
MAEVNGKEIKFILNSQKQDPSHEGSPHDPNPLLPSTREMLQQWKGQSIATHSPDSHARTSPGATATASAVSQCPSTDLRKHKTDMHEATSAMRTAAMRTARHARIEQVMGEVMGDTQMLSLDEKLDLLKLHAAGHKVSAVQAWELVKAFRETRLCFKAAQWAFGLLFSVEDKDAFSEVFDAFLATRVREKRRQQSTVR